MNQDVLPVSSRRLIQTLKPNTTIPVKSLNLRHTLSEFLFKVTPKSDLQQIIFRKKKKATIFAEQI